MQGVSLFIERVKWKTSLYLSQVKKLNNSVDLFDIKDMGANATVVLPVRYLSVVFTCFNPVIRKST